MSMKGTSGAIGKGFKTREEAERFVAEMSSNANAPKKNIRRERNGGGVSTITKKAARSKKARIAAAAAAAAKKQKQQEKEQKRQAETLRRSFKEPPFRRFLRGIPVHSFVLTISRPSNTSVTPSFRSPILRIGLPYWRSLLQLPIPPPLRRCPPQITHPRYPGYPPRSRE